MEDGSVLRPECDWRHGVSVWERRGERRGWCIWMREEGVDFIGLRPREEGKERANIV